MICQLFNERMSCNNISTFANSVKANIELKLSEGKGELTNFKSSQDSIIRICGNQSFECDENELINEKLIYTTHTLDSENTFSFKYAYIEKELNVDILDKINIITISSETLAFEIFKQKVGNYIFIIPTVKQPINYDNGYIDFKQHYIILILLYNKQDINSYEHIDKINEIENELINILLYADYDFNSSEFVFTTQYTLIKKLNITQDIRIDRVHDECYYLVLNNPDCDNI